jgi:hypothetical protein
MDCLQWRNLQAPGSPVRPGAAREACSGSTPTPPRCLAWEMVGGSARALFRLDEVEPGAARALVCAEVRESFVSPRYGVKEKTSALRFQLTSDLPLTCRFQIEVS